MEKYYKYRNYSFSKVFMGKRTERVYCYPAIQNYGIDLAIDLNDLPEYTPGEEEVEITEAEYKEAKQRVIGILTGGVE